MAISEAIIFRKEARIYSSEKRIRSNSCPIKNTKMSKPLRLCSNAVRKLKRTASENARDKPQEAQECPSMVWCTQLIGCAVPVAEKIPE